MGSQFRRLLHGPSIPLMRDPFSPYTANGPVRDLCERTMRLRSRPKHPGKSLPDATLGRASAVSFPILRAPSRRRPLSRKFTAAPDGVDVARVAAEATYIGSAEHKDRISGAGAPSLRADATPCPPDLTDPSELTGWLRAAIVAGNTGAQWEQGFPRYAWWREGERCFEARLVNAGLGEYKGWPLAPAEWPETLRS